MATINPSPDLRGLPDDALIRLKQVLRIYHVGRSTWLRGVAAGEYPQPIKKGGITFWRYGDVIAIARKVAESSMQK